MHVRDIRTNVWELTLVPVGLIPMGFPCKSMLTSWVLDICLYSGSIEIK
jgi:hypothetical protein